MRSQNKSRAAAGVLGVLTALTLALPASAHCGSGRNVHHTEDARCVAACTVKDCSITGRHLHSGVTYCGTHHEDGVCTTACYAAAACTVEDCSITGRHVHDGVTYCGTHHEDGVCTAECYTAAATAAPAAASGHHGHHRSHHRGHC